MYAKPPLIARFMGPTWSPSVADRTQVGPCWPHELCYLGHLLMTVLTSDLSWGHRHEVVAMEPPCIVFVFRLVYHAVVFRLCHWLPLRCLGPWTNHLPPVFWSIFGKSILNKLVCKFNKMENILLCLIFIYCDSTYWYILPPMYFSLSYFYFHFSNSF